MPLPSGCPVWTYSAHPNRKTLLPAATKKVLTELYSGAHAVEGSGRDTRPVHKALFHDLAPKEHKYYAGTYRGCFDHPCLVAYTVHIPSDSLVGAEPPFVKDRMTKFGDIVVSAVRLTENEITRLGAIADQRAQTISIVRISCLAFVEFLTIHPYVDGNGHVARFLLFLILFRFGLVANAWTIEPRPPFPDYGEMIARYRRNDKNPLEQFVLSCVSRV